MNPARANRRAQERRWLGLRPALRAWSYFTTARKDGQDPQRTFASESVRALFQETRQIPSAVDDRDYLQRLRLGAIDDKPGIHQEEPHGSNGQIASDVADSRILGEELDLLFDYGFNAVCNDIPCFLPQVPPYSNQIGSSPARENILLIHRRPSALPNTRQAGSPGYLHPG